jgi:hypothetical protein
MIRLVQKRPEEGGDLPSRLEMVKFTSLQSSYLRPYRLVRSGTIFRCKMKIGDNPVGEYFLLKQSASQWVTGLNRGQFNLLSGYTTADEPRETRMTRRCIGYYLTGSVPFNFRSEIFRRAIPESQHITGSLSLHTGTQDMLEYLCITDLELLLPKDYKESCKR